MAAHHALARHGVEDVVRASLTIGRVIKTIGKWYVQLLIPANIVGFIFVGLVLLLAAYGISFGPIQP